MKKILALLSIVTVVTAVGCNRGGERTSGVGTGVQEEQRRDATEAGSGSTMNQDSRTIEDSRSIEDSRTMEDPQSMEDSRPMGTDEGTGSAIEQDAGSTMDDGSGSAIEESGTQQ